MNKAKALNKALPVIVLVGRNNVGKSTLFNRLTRTRDALVANSPGLTRDRKYGRVVVGYHEFICIDTGGIDVTEKDGVETSIAKQSLLAIEEADVIIFMVDASMGLMPADITIAKQLRSREKPTLLVANKTDGIDVYQAMAEFWSLGLGDIYPIAALHGRGVTSLLETVLLPLIEKMNPLDKEVESREHFKAREVTEKEQAFKPLNMPIKLAIVGRPNVGKSMLINRILGEERVVVYNMPGTTRDSIYIPMQHDGCDYVLIDTAGVRKRSKITDLVEKFSVIKTIHAIEDANVVMLVIDARAGVSDQDLSLLSFILNRGRSLVIVINKWDGLSQKVKEQVKEMINLRLGFIDNFARLHFISALHGSGVGNLFQSVREAYNSAHRRVGTAMLTRIMTMATEYHQPLLVRGRRVKLKYAHASGYNPLKVVIHGNQVKDLPDSYKRYLMNYFRKSLDIVGTPICIQFKDGDNPFANKRKTPILKKRKNRRIISSIKKKK